MRPPGPANATRHSSSSSSSRGATWLSHALAKADCVIALGSHDTRVAERAADVLLEGWAPLLVCSGHLGGLTSGMWTRSEAEIFADVAVGRGVPRERILIESR